MSTAVVIMPAILLTRKRATSYVVVPLPRPTVAIISGDRYYAGYTTISFECWGRFFTDIVPLRLKKFWNRWPDFLQCEQVTTAKGVDVTTIADPRPFAFREGPFRIAPFAYILRIVITARSSVKSSSASALYFICKYSSVSPSSTVASMLSSLNTSPISTSSSRK